MKLAARLRPFLPTLVTLIVSYSAWAFVVFALLGCEWLSNAPPPKNAPTGDDFADACANMLRLGDPAGSEEGCAEHLEQIHARGTVSMEPKCLARAHTRADLDACYSDTIVSE
jgi:hypothetical protein